MAMEGMHTSSHWPWHMSCSSHPWPGGSKVLLAAELSPMSGCMCVAGGTVAPHTLHTSPMPALSLVLSGPQRRQRCSKQPQHGGDSTQEGSCHGS